MAFLSGRILRKSVQVREGLTARPRSVKERNSFLIHRCFAPRRKWHSKPLADGPISSQCIILHANELALYAIGTLESMVQVSFTHAPNQDPHGCTKGETQCPYRDARCFLCLWPPAAALSWRVVRWLQGRKLAPIDRLNIGFIGFGGYGIYALKKPAEREHRCPVRCGLAH